MDRQEYAPLLLAMQRYVQTGAAPFHTPGHKQGQGIHPLLAEVIGPAALAMDVSLMSELDDLHEPQSCIKEAQELAAELYGADHSFFIVNGTTGGIHAMILTVAGPGDKIIVPRNAHRSVIGGIILSGAQPVFIQPATDYELGLAMGVELETVEAAIRQHPDAKAVLLVHPTYYGVAADIQSIIELVHANNMAVLVDEAHGPHLRFHEQLPIQALSAGADIVAQSTHKLLGAMTQCSMVHCREVRVSVDKLKTMLRLLQSTSPNYLLLASLDVARMQMAVDGPELLGRAVKLANWARQQINAISGLYCFGSETIGRPGVFALDPTKLTVTVTGLGLTGVEAEQILRQRYNIQAELTDLYNVLFLITIGDNEQTVQKLLAALRGLSADCRGKRDFSAVREIMQAGACSLPEGAVLPRQALLGSTRTVLFSESAGLICAEIITFYPPGIPLLCPGERITNEIIAYCRQQLAAGLLVSGPDDSTLISIKVVC
ncbi:MAG: Arginine decarboxylase [Firmicutes bacterium]|nr:Arginine decarboxylase [Bacillota bacterium]